ncbi:MAG: zf-HC2 domain-containing protein [Gemmatimonadota bacterium]|nr:zf-HC2 domain-containing protein [Gemmatimonadota bacterium]
MNNHTDILPLLDDYADGGLDPAARARVEAHLASCAACRAEVAALAAILAEARALPRTIEPGRDLWPGIAPRLAARPARRLPWLQLAAALALFAGGFAAARLGQKDGPPTRLATLQAEYTAASTELAHRLAGGSTGLAPETRRVVDRNLEIIDQAIREAEAALAGDPANGALEQMLVARYEQRLELLRRATAAGRQES